MSHPDDAQRPQDETPDQARAKADLLEQALFNLTPYFMDGALGDPARARRAALELLNAYPIRSVLELQLATEFIAFSQSAVDNLRAAASDPEMPEAKCQKLRSRAVSLSRAGHRSLATLEKVFASRQKTDANQPAETPAKLSVADLDPEQAAMFRGMKERIAQYQAQMAAQQAANQG
jgi:hypothetical protein